jgi:hypothetical protein
VIFRRILLILFFELCFGIYAKAQLIAEKPVNEFKLSDGPLSFLRGEDVNIRQFAEDKLLIFDKRYVVIYNYRLNVIQSVFDNSVLNNDSLVINFIANFSSKDYVHSHSDKENMLFGYKEDNNAFNSKENLNTKFLQNKFFVFLRLGAPYYLHKGTNDKIYDHRVMGSEIILLVLDTLMVINKIAFLNTSTLDKIYLNMSTDFYFQNKQLLIPSYIYLTRDKKEKKFQKSFITSWFFTDKNEIVLKDFYSGTSNDKMPQYAFKGNIDYMKEMNMHQMAYAIPYKFNEYGNKIVYSNGGEILELGTKKTIIQNNSENFNISYNTFHIDSSKLIINILTRKNSSEEYKSSIRFYKRESNKFIQQDILDLGNISQIRSVLIDDKAAYYIYLTKKNDAYLKMINLN